MTYSGRTAVVVVSYGSHGMLERTLLPSTAGTGAHVVVVDSFSTIEERHAITELARRHGWTLLTPDHNTGFGGGCNLGVRAALDAGADAVVLLNPDASLPRGGVSALADLARADRRSLVAPVIRRPDGTWWSRGTTDLRLADGTMRASWKRPEGETAVQEWLSGACLALSAELWELVGGFDERYFLYWEDVDLSRRVLASGGRLVVADEVVAVHDEGGTHDGARPGGRAKSETYYYWSIRNRLLFAATWLDDRTLRVWVRRTPRTAWSVLLQGGRRQLLRSGAPWRAAVRGTRAALVSVRRERPAAIGAALFGTQPGARTQRDPSRVR